jgi:hypothetical protein
MIQCLKCETNNLATLEKCDACGANLLPGEGIGERIGNVIAGILGGIIAGVAAYLMIQAEIETPDCWIISPASCMFAAFAVPVMGIVSALRKTPLHQRYARRARRHVELDMEQAVADYSKALENAPEDERAGLLKERAELYEKLGMQEEAVRDRLEYTSSPGAYKTGRGVTRLIGGDADTYAQEVGKDERKRLVAEGTVTALGYCPKCKDVIELNADLWCPIHPSVKPRAERFVLPDDMEATIPEILTEQLRMVRARRTVYIVVGLIVGSTLACCVFSAVMNNLR